MLRDPRLIAIPEAGDEAHVTDNRRAVDLALTAQELAAIDMDFPPPMGKARLAML